MDTANLEVYCDVPREPTTPPIQVIEYSDWVMPTREYRNSFECTHASWYMHWSSLQYVHTCIHACIQTHTDRHTLTRVHRTKHAHIPFQWNLLRRQPQFSIWAWLIVHQPAKQLLQFLIHQRKVAHSGNQYLYSGNKQTRPMVNRCVLINAQQKTKQNNRVFPNRNLG